MKRTVYYRMCLVAREDRSETRLVPEKIAIVGKVLRLKSMNREWQDGWEVKKVYETRYRSVGGPVEVKENNKYKQSRRKDK